MPTYKKIFYLSFFSILSGMITPLQGLIDVALISQSANTAELSALGISTQLLAIMLASFNFLQYATSGQTAQAIGKKDSTKTLIAILQRSCLIAIVLGMILFILRNIISDIGLNLISDSKNAKIFAKEYLSIRFLDIIAQLLWFVISGFLIGLGKTRQLFFLQSLITSSNIILSILFIKVFNMNIIGVALGTTIAFWLSIIIGFYYLQKILNTPINFLIKCDKSELNLKKFNPLFSLNIDIFIRTLILTLSFAWITKIAGFYGDVFLASYILLMQIMTLSAYALDGIAIAAETLCGQAIGQQNKKVFYAVIKKTGLVIVCFAGILSLFWFIIMPYYLDFLIKEINLLSISKQYANFVIMLPIIGVWAYWLDGIYFGATAGRYIRYAYLITGMIFIIGSWYFFTYYKMQGVYLSVYWLFVLRAVSLSLLLPKLISDKFPDS